MRRTIDLGEHRRCRAHVGENVILSLPVESGPTKTGKDGPFYIDDTTHSPIIIRTYQRVGTDEEFIENLNTMRDYLYAPQHYGFVLDFGKSLVITREQRKLQAHWLVEHSAALSHEPYGNGFVVRNSIQRFVLWTIYLITKIPGRNHVTNSIEDALTFVAAGIVANGDTVPPSLRTLLASPSYASFDHEAPL